MATSIPTASSCSAAALHSVISSSPQSFAQSRVTLKPSE